MGNGGCYAFREPGVATLDLPDGRAELALTRGIEASGDFTGKWTGNSLDVPQVRSPVCAGGTDFLFRHSVPHASVAGAEGDRP